MRSSLASCLLLSGSLLSVVGCVTDSTDPTPPPPPPPPAFTRWSEPASWPGGAIPAAGENVVIPADKTVVLDVSPPALGSLTVDGTLRFEEKDLSLTSNWIIVRGRFEIGTEAAPFTHRAVITLTGPSGENIQGTGAKVLGIIAGGRLELHGERRDGWARLSATAGVGSNQLVLERAMPWRVGDHIAIASTDLDPLQSEDAYITAISGNTITLRNGLRNSHYGLIQTIAGKTLDERAEVGLLSRNIVIQGDSASLVSEFGGHVLATSGGALKVEGIELTRMGQKKVLARYPMHWHMNGAVDGQYFRGSSVWKSFNRCVTVHGSDNATVQGNVCYDNIGHGYFLEDGGETGNLFEDNLGILARTPAAGQALIPSDATPATFWITNPANTYRRNVAAGSRGFGFWFAFPAAPTGLSTGDPDKPRETPLGEFSDNVAHSNSNTGLNVDHGPMADGTIETVHYSPRQVPGTSSPAVTANFRNFTAYKHRGRGVWLRGTELRLNGAMLADNGIGATFASNETFVMDAMFVGQSGNSGGSQIQAGFPIRGYEFYDGRVGAERVTFVNYATTPARIMSALGFNRTNGFPVDPTNYAKQLTFVNSNNVFIENPGTAFDGDRAAVILDNDGSLTGIAGAYVAANNPLMVTSACSRRDPWNAWVCQAPFVQFQVRGANGQVVAPLGIVRDDAAAATYVGVPGQPQTVSASVVAARTYRVQYSGGTPDRPQFYLRRSVPGSWIRIIAPYPNANFNVIRDNNSGSPLGAVATLAELDASTGNKYFYDAAGGLLHLKAVTQTGRTQATLFVVPK
jgi:hypothetical protein